MLYSTTYSSPVGEITLAASESALKGAWIAGQKYHGGTIGKTLTPKGDLPLFAQVSEWLDEYFAGQNPAISRIPLAAEGSEFRKAVWEILCEIPYGALTTYGEIAKQMAARTGRASMSAQAVGGAVGHNPISIIVPCHRVVGAQGSLTGYAGGIGVKVQLLEHEGVDLTNLFVPTRGTAL